MAKTPLHVPPHSRHTLYTTTHEGLGDDIATLQAIFAGEYSGFDVEAQLRRVAQNLGVLLSVHMTITN